MGATKTLGHPRMALLGFAVAVLAYNALALPQQATGKRPGKGWD